MRLLHLLLGSVLLMAGCKRGVGSSCDKGEARCLDRERQLVCDQGKFIESPCRGPEGCSLAPKGVSCDVSANKPGDLCSRDDEGAAACTDPKTLISCRGGSYQPSPCRGPDGCVASEGRPKCDTSVATSGDACAEQEKPKACSTDGKTLLACKGGTMQTELPCRGPDGCKITASKLDCDLTLAELADPCPSEMDGRHACAVDRKTMLVCKDGKFAPDSPCKAGESCLVEGGSIRCGKL